jgi:hypothetical protein
MFICREEISVNKNPAGSYILPATLNKYAFGRHENISNCFNFSTEMRNGLLWQV